MRKKNLLTGAVSVFLLISLTACGAGTVVKTGSAASQSMGEEESEMKKESTSEMMNPKTPAPDFEMMDLDGNTVKLSDFNGEKVYLKYWASWCPICLGGLEDINTLSAEENDFRVLTIVAPGQKGDKNTEDFKKWFSGVENTEHITVLFDTDGAYGTQAGVRGYPTSEYIGSDGVMVRLVPGHADNETIKTVFESVK